MKLSITDQKFQELMEIACDVFGVTEKQVLSKSRKNQIVFCRKAITHIAYDELRMSYMDIGRRLGNRDHTTCIAALKSSNNLIYTKHAGYYNQYKSITSAFSGINEGEISITSSVGARKEYLTFDKNISQIKKNKIILEMLEEILNDDNVQGVVNIRLSYVKI